MDASGITAVEFLVEAATKLISGAHGGCANLMISDSSTPCAATSVPVMALAITTAGMDAYAVLLLL